MLKPIRRLVFVLVGRETYLVTDETFIYSFKELSATTISSPLRSLAETLSKAMLVVAGISQYLNDLSDPNMSVLTPQLRLRRALVAVLYAVVVAEVIAALVPGGMIWGVVFGILSTYLWKQMQVHIFTLLGAQPLPLGDYSDYTGSYALKKRWRLTCEIYEMA
jgi:hypothetical protein